MKTTSKKRSIVLVLAMVLVFTMSQAKNSGEPSFYFSKEVEGTYEEVLERIKTALKKVEFGVVSEMMISNTLNEKVQANMETYAILGICNPSFALQAMQAEENIGLMLPCKAIIRKTGTDKYVVAFQNPEVLMQSLNNPELNKVSKEVAKRLKEALNAV